MKRGGLMNSYSEYIPVFKALADETRLKIIDMLSCGEMCACDILEKLSITQPTLSYHMKMLTECGLINGVREGTWMRYTINHEKMGRVAELIRYISTDKEDCICRTCDRKV
jgi:ArsR family transcriptional regulator